MTRLSELNQYYLQGDGTAARTPLSSPSTLLTDMVSFFDYEETTGNRLDSHGSNVLVPYVGYPVDYAAGVASNAAWFKGFADWFTATAGHDMHGGDRDFTYAAKFKFDSKAKDTALGGVYPTSASSPIAFDWMLYYYTVPNAMRFYMGFSYTWYFATSTVSIALDTWYLAICKYEASTKTISISVNGETPVTAVGVGTPNNTGDVFTDGLYYSSPYWFYGKKDWACFNSRLITPAEEAELLTINSYLDLTA